MVGDIELLQTICARLRYCCEPRVVNLDLLVDPLPLLLLSQLDQVLEHLPQVTSLLKYLALE